MGFGILIVLFVVVLIVLFFVWKSKSPKAR